MKRKIYISPDINIIELDYTITLQMQTTPNPTDPPPRTDGDGNKSQPFASPFGDRPFG